MITTLSELIQRTVRKAMDETRVSMPAKVVSYDAGRRIASVQILQPEYTTDGKEIGQPVIAEVPVFMPIGGGSAITHPVRPGDTGIVLFADQDIGGWVHDGDTSKSESKRRHSLTDGMFIAADGRGAAHSDNLVISYGGATISIHPSGDIDIDSPGEINIKASGDVAITSAGLTHNGTNVGDTHVHPINGGSSAPGPTGEPQ